MKERAAVRSRGVSLLAALLIASPLVQWAYISALSYFTILEPPFTGSRGILLAMQLFFAPGNVVAIALGIGLFLRNEWTRRIARVVLVAAVATSAWFVGLQFATWRFDSSILLALLSLAVGAACLWYFGLPSVRDEFRPREDSRMVLEAAPPKTGGQYSRPLVIAANGEILFGLAAALLLVHLYFAFAARPLLDVGPGFGVTEADEFLRNILFVAFALFLAPHALTTAASIGILIRRDTLRVARRYTLMACWTIVAAALVAAWLATREGFAFDARSARYVYLFCGASFAWHAWFLRILRHYRSER